MLQKEAGILNKIQQDCGGAEKTVGEFHCQVDIITHDVSFVAWPRGSATVKASYLEEYIGIRKNLVDVGSLKK